MGTAFLPRPCDGLILEIGPRLDGHVPRFSIIQPPPRRFLPAVDFPGRRRSGSWSQVINQAQDFPAQDTRHGKRGAVFLGGQNFRLKAPHPTSRGCLFRDGLCPGTIAAAVHSGHAYARGLDGPKPEDVPFRRERATV